MRHGPSQEAQKGSWEWLEFAAQLPAQPFVFGPTAANALVYSGRCILLGGSYLNSATAAGTVQLLDGQDATGGLVVATAVAASSPATPNLPGQGILCEIGVFLLPGGTTIKGSVYVIPLAHYDFTPPGT